MIVHDHTPDCRHLTDKPARLDLTTFFYIAAVQLGTRFRTWSAHRANLSQPRRFATDARASTRLPDTCEAASPPLQVRCRTQTPAAQKRMMNFLGQMRGICLTPMLRKGADSNDGSM